MWMALPKLGFATHNMGKDIQYTCLGLNGAGQMQYRVTVRYYRNCRDGASSASPAPGSITLEARSTGCTISSSLVLNPDPASVPPNGSEVSQLCPAQLPNSGCNYSGPGLAPYPGVQVYTYTGTVTVPANCTQVMFGTTECCRNGAINNIPNPGSQSLGVYCVINQDPSTGELFCNNSATFTELPVTFVCANSDVTYNHGVVDADGDSLVFTQINPLGDGGSLPYAPINYSSGWSISDPVRNSGGFFFDTHTGQMQFTPAYQEQDVIAVRVDEYRNGVLIGSTMRDIQVVVQNCAISIPEQDPITNVQNGNQVDSLNVQACPGTPLQFDILCTDPANHNLTLNSSINANPSAIPGAAFTQVGTGDSVKARINWTPLASDTGCHNFTVIAKNDDCPINGSKTRVYTICVFNQVRVLTASPTFCGTPVQLTATGGTNYTWTPSTGPNAVSNPNVLNPTVTPVSNTTYYFTSDCGTDSVFVRADPPFTYDAGPGGSICQNGQVHLNATTDNLYAPYHLQWVPAAGLTDPVTNLPTDSVLNPVASPLNTTKYKLYITGANGCTNVDSLTVNVTGTGPAIVAKANPLAVCPKDPVQLDILTNPVMCGISQTPCSGNIVTGQVGTGTTVIPGTGSPTQYPTIYGHYQNSGRHQFLYLNSELLAQYPSGGEIRSISFNINQINASNDVMKNFEIKMGCTQAASLTSWQPNMVTVFSPKDVAVNTTGWITHTLDFPYNWDGTSNLVIEVCFNNPTNGVLNAKMTGTTTTFNSVYYSVGSTNQCGTTGSPQTSVKRPNAKFDICITSVSGLPISWTPATGPNAPAPANIVNPIAHPETPVIYNVDVTDLNGCKSSDYVYVSVDTSVRMNAFPPDTFLCAAGNVTFTTTTLGTPLPGQQFAYQWKNITTNTVVGTNSPTLSFNATTTADYLVTLTGAACTLTDTVHLVVGNSIPVNVTAINITCNGANDGKVKAIVTGGIAPLTYTWSPAAANIDSLTGLAPGTYAVTVHDSQNCTGTNSATVTEPAVLAATKTQQNVLCNGNSTGSISLTVTGGTSPYTYVWSPVQTNSPNATGLNAGSYSVTITDGHNCSTSASATITEPTALAIATGSTDAVTNGGNEGTAYVGATGGTGPYVFTWSNSGNTDTIRNLIKGTYYVTVCDANGCCRNDSAFVNDPPPIIVTYTKVNNLCFGDCNGKAVASASGAIPPYSFLWSTGSTVDSIINLCAGAYQVTVTDSAGVSVTSSVTISQPTQVTILLDTTDITCFGANNGAVNAIASGGTPSYTYAWNTGTGTNNNPLSNLGPGTYTVVATDANSCTAQASWTAIEPTQLTVSITGTTNISCYGGTDGTATALAAGGTPAYTYNWSVIGTATANATGFPSGSHAVTVTDSRSCVATATFTLTQPAVLTSTISATNASCNGYTDGAVDLTVTGGTTPYGYSWTGGATTEDLTAVAANTYTVTITDANNCTITNMATVAEPTAITLAFGSRGPLCAGGSTGEAWVSANGGTPGYIYDWSTTATTNDIDTLYGLPAGYYDVIVTDAASCTVTGGVDVIDPPSLNASLINKHEISCADAADGAVEVSVTGGTPPIFYNWNNGFAGNSFTNIAPGNYAITITDNNGCDTTLNITFNAPPAIDILFLAVDSASCPDYTDGSIQVSAIGGTPGATLPYEYSLDGTSYQGNEFFANLGAGIYHLYIRDGQGCIKDTTVSVAEPVKLNLSVLPTDTTISLGNSILLYSSIGNYSGADINFYTWGPINGITCADCASTIATPYYSTDYTLTVNYLQNCTVSETVNIFVADGEDFFVPNAFTPNGDGNNDVFVVYGTGLSMAKLQVFNRWGEKVYDSGNQWAGWDGNYKGQPAVPGVYTYYVEVVYLNGKSKEKKGTITLIR